ncbi:hypothetical protein VB735_07575 [Halotia wernerae UHCC 0503]|nr:hypothetical protein [Halotia wernerae UHCC 0503]
MISSQNSETGKVCSTAACRVFLEMPGFGNAIAYNSLAAFLGEIFDLTGSILTHILHPSL